jgi:putative ABC transport system permease protein
MRPASTCDLAAGGTPQQVACYGVEANFLRTFGITPDLGRDFAPQDDLPRAPTVIPISHRLWQQVFGGDAQILGRTVTLNEEPVRIIGILPQRFEMPQLGDWDVLLPERLDASLPHSVNSNSALRTFARLRDGVSIAEARDQMRPLFEAGVKEDVPAQLRVEVRLVVRSLRERQIHEVKQASWMLLGAVFALLLIACANIANLLLARAAARRRELAVRAAIGAGRGRLIRQLLTESLLLGLAGSVGGCGLGWVLLRALVRLAPDGLVGLGLAAIQLRVLLFAPGTSLAAALLFGIAPALEQPRAESLIGWRAAAAAPMALRRCLVAAQVAISLVLLTGASLFLRSLWKLETQPLGFRPERLLTASFTLRRQRYQAAAEQAAFFQQLETRLKTISGGGSFALSDSIPPRGSMGRPYSNMRIAGHLPLAQNGGLVAFRWVTPGLFPSHGDRDSCGPRF